MNNTDKSFRIERDPLRPGQWQVRNLSTGKVIAVGLHRDTAIQHVWMLGGGAE